MRGLAVVVVWIVLALVPGVHSNLRAQEGPGEGDFPAGMYERIPLLKLPSRDVVEVLTMLAEQGGINIVVSKAVSGHCTLRLANATIKDAFDIVLRSNDLAYEKIGDIYYVMTGAEYTERYGAVYGDAREVKVFRLKHAVPEKAFDLIEALKTEKGRVVVDEESGTVLIMDAPNKIKRIEEGLAVLEEESEISVFNLGYAKAADVQDRLKVYLEPGGKAVGSVIADDQTNSVIVTTLTKRMQGVERLIAALDKKTQQVLIDTKIIEIRLNDDFAAELKWEGIFTTLSGVDFLSSHCLDPMWRTGKSFIGQYTAINPDDNLPAGSKSIPGEKIFFGEVKDDYAFEGLLTFLRTLGDVKILSNPKIAVVDGQEAKVHIGSKLPYVVATTTAAGGAGGAATTAEDVKFVDIGIILSVTPTINDEGYVTMNIKPEVSSAMPPYTTPAGSEIPVVDTSLVETTVMVKDNTTIMIGGLRKEAHGTSIRKVPVLGSIPLLGFLFRSQQSSSLRSELLIMLTPHLVSGDVLQTGDVIMPEEGLKPYVDYDGEVGLLVPAGGEGGLDLKPALSGARGGERR